MHMPRHQSDGRALLSHPGRWGLHSFSKTVFLAFSTLQLLMTTLPRVRLSSIVGVYSSSYSKSPDTGLHSRVAFSPPIPIAVFLRDIRKGNVHEGILVPQERLRFWAGHADPAHHDGADASGRGRAPGRLPQSGGGMGGRSQLSQTRAPQSV